MSVQEPPRPLFFAPEKLLKKLLMIGIRAGSGAVFR